MSEKVSLWILFFPRVLTLYYGTIDQRVSGEKIRHAEWISINLLYITIENKQRHICKKSKFTIKRDFHIFENENTVTFPATNGKHEVKPQKIV